MKKTHKIAWTIFFVALPFVVFYFLNFDFKGTFNGIFRSFCNKNFGCENQIPDSWLERYSIDLRDSSIDSDTDGDGLSLLAEYENSTNPLNPDTDGDGYNDGKEVTDGYSPIGEGKLDKDQDGLLDFWEEENGLSTKEANGDQDPDDDGLSNYLEFAHLTNPLNADTDGDEFTDAEEIQNGYDPTTPGDIRPKFSIHIDKIHVIAPIVWSKVDEEKALLKDLEEGVARLPETAIPGQNGNAVISGHSSNYVWAKGEYNYIFQNLNDLVIGDQIIIKATQENGKTVEYSYTIKSKSVVEPNDTLIFEKAETPTITLVTCWPLRTTWKRMVIKAELETK